MGKILTCWVIGAHARSEYVCMYVCIPVCMSLCVHSYLPPHTLESQKRDTNIFLAIQRSLYILPIFLASFESYGVICLPRGSSLFHGPERTVTTPYNTERTEIRGTEIRGNVCES